MRWLSTETINTSQVHQIFDLMMRVFCLPLFLLAVLYIVCVGDVNLRLMRVAIYLMRLFTSTCFVLFCFVLARSAYSVNNVCTRVRRHIYKKD